MIYLLDTNVCIRALRMPDADVVQRLQSLSPGDVALSSVTVFELYYGAFRSAKREANRRQVSLFVSQFALLPFDERTAQQAGAIRSELAAKGTPIGPYDLLIAATALAHDLTLVTHNTGEFERVAGLALEDWQRSG